MVECQTRNRESPGWNPILYRSNFGRRQGAIMAEDLVSPKLLNEWARISCIDGVLCRKLRKNGDTIQQLIVPEALMKQILDTLHDQVGHQATEKTIALARARCFWPGMARDVEEHYKTCKQCMLAKAGKPC